MEIAVSGDHSKGGLIITNKPSHQLTQVIKYKPYLWVLTPRLIITQRLAAAELINPDDEEASSGDDE